MASTVCKVIVLGDVSVGKTCLINALSKQAFADTGTTGQVSFTRIVHGGRQLNVWDTPGNDKTLAMGAQYMRECDVALVCFDISSPESLQKLKDWKDVATQKGKPTLKFILVGTKSDKRIGNEDSPDFVSQECIDDVVDSDWNGSKYYETSAKNGTGIDELLDELSRIEVPLKPGTGPVDLSSKKPDPNGPEESRNCC
jgi:small GTP-binding protein